jgi:predicted P-loop ATPase
MSAPIKPPPMDPWAPNVRATDVPPIAPEGLVNPLEGGADEAGSDLNTRKLAVTFIRDETGKEMLCEYATLPELAEHIGSRTAADKMELPWLKLATFGNKRTENNSLRHNENVEEISGIEGDYDGEKDGSEELSFDEAVARVSKANIRALLYTSSSYVPGVKERWRIVAPLSQHRRDDVRGTLRAKYVARINGLFDGKLDGASFTLSQGFLYGHLKGAEYRVEVIDGDFIDLADRTYAGSIFKDGSKVGDQAANDRQQHKPRRDDASEPVDRDKIEAALDVIDSNCKREMWLKVAAALHHELGEPGFELFDRWSSRGTGTVEVKGRIEPFYTPEKTRKLWDGARSMHSVTINTLFHYADQADPGWRQRYADEEGRRFFERMANRASAAGGGASGDSGGEGADSVSGEAEADWRKHLLLTDKGVPKSLLANAITALSGAPAWQGVLSYDQFAMQTTVRAAPPWYIKPMGPVPRAWSDHDDLLTAEWLQRAGIAVNTQTAAQAVEAVARGRAFHPVIDYLSALQHDGQPRLGTWLATCLGADQTAFNETVGRAMLIAAVARIFEPGCKVDTVPIFEGAQGARKSTAVKALFDPWFSDELADLGSKDAAMQTRGVWGIEVSELDAMSRMEVSRIKAFITRTTDRFRPPYGSRVIESPRTCVFWGTTNSDGYLKDETGGRRFWPVRVGNIKVDLLRELRDQLWAEAVVMYRGEVPWWITKTETLKDAERHQRDRYIGDPWDKVIADYVEMASEVTIDDVRVAP